MVRTLNKLQKECFIEEYDLSGKTIIPFCAHGTGGLASSVKDITDALPDSAEVLEPIGVYRPDVDSAQPVINEWLDSLGYTEESMTQAQEMIGTDEGVENMAQNRIESREYRDVAYDTLSEAQKWLVRFYREKKALLKAGKDC